MKSIPKEDRFKSKMPDKAQGRSDIFQTSEQAVADILPYIPREWKIWESAAGEGRIVEALRADGRQVIGTDILNGFDFCEPMSSAMINFDCILTNPPYSIKDDWLQRCFDIGKPFALLLPITAMGEQKRVAMFKKYGIELLMPRARYEFITPNGTEGGAWFYTAWFCHGLNLPAPITYV